MFEGPRHPTSLEKTLERQRKEIDKLKSENANIHAALNNFIVRMTANLNLAESMFGPSQKGKKTSDDKKADTTQPTTTLISRLEVLAEGIKTVLSEMTDGQAKAHSLEIDKRRLTRHNAELQSDVHRLEREVEELRAELASFVPKTSCFGKESTKVFFKHSHTSKPTEEGIELRGQGDPSNYSTL